MLTGGRPSVEVRIVFQLANTEDHYLGSFPFFFTPWELVEADKA